MGLISEGIGPFDPAAPVHVACRERGDDDLERSTGLRYNGAIQTTLTTMNTTTTNVNPVIFTRLP